jgi:hypothetical protein
MAEKISVQIALEGGAEIQRQLAGIGEAGQKAFADIAKSAEQVGGFKNIKPEEVTAKLQQLGITGVEAINKIQAAVKSAGRLETLVQGIATAETALKALAIAAVPVGAAIAAAMVAATKATISFAASISKVAAEARKMGVSIEQFDKMRLAFEGAGVSAQDVTGIMQRLGQAAAKADLSKVTQAFKELQEAATRGFGGQGTTQLQALEQAARKAGEAGKAAREFLVQLGQPIPTGVAQTLEELIAKTGSAEAGLQAFIAQLQQMPPGVERDKLAMQELGVGADQLIAAFDRLRAAGAGAITPDMVSKADSVTAAVNRLTSAWDRFGSVSFAPVVVAELNTITAALQALQNLINNFSWSNFISAAAAAGQALEWLTPGGLISKGLREIIQLLGQATAARTGGEGTAIPGIAGGGVIGGRGTGTSDSNLAWVSRGEHIMPARAVAQPGVLAFLEALRRSGGNLSHVLDGMGRFALGGLVPRPAFAGGGAVGSMSHVTIQFPGLQPIGGLRASAEVVDQLQRAAALAQVRSGGRKPSRYS